VGLACGLLAGPKRDRDGPPGGLPGSVAPPDLILRKTRDPPKVVVVLLVGAVRPGA